MRTSAPGQHLFGRGASCSRALGRPRTERQVFSKELSLVRLVRKCTSTLTLANVLAVVCLKKNILMPGVGTFCHCFQRIEDIDQVALN